jgi:hypothetical protein
MGRLDCIVKYYLIVLLKTSGHLSYEAAFLYCRRSGFIRGDLLVPLDEMVSLFVKGPSWLCN